MSLYYDVSQSGRHFEKEFWRAFWWWAKLIIWKGIVVTGYPVAGVMLCLILWDNWAQFKAIFDIELGQWPDFSTISIQWIFVIAPAALAIIMRVIVTTVFLKKRYEKKIKEQVVKGNKLAKASEFRALYLKKHRNERIVWHGNISVSLDRMTAGGELYVGTTRSGKSTLMDQVLEQEIDFGVKCLIYDSEQTKIERFFNPATDAIINPFDARGLYLPLNSIIKDEISPFTAARALFPEGYSSETKWFNKAGQEIVQDIFLYLYRTNRVEWEEFFEIMQGGTHKIRRVLESIAKDDASSGAIRHFSQGSDSEQDQGNMATLSTYTTGLQHIIKSKKNGSIDIEKWVFQDDPEGNIFLTSSEEYATELINLHSLIVNIYGFNIFKRPEGSGQYFSLDADEFDDLNPLDIIIKLNKKGGKRGNINKFGAQGISQITDKYGSTKRDTLLQTINQDFIFTTPDPTTAEFLSKRLSKKMINRTDISLNLPDHNEEKNHRATTESYLKREEEKPLVTESDLMNLPFYEFYHRATGYPITKDETVKPRKKNSNQKDRIFKQKEAVQLKN